MNTLLPVTRIVLGQTRQVGTLPRCQKRPHRDRCYDVGEEGPGGREPGEQNRNNAAPHCRREGQHKGRSQDRVAVDQGGACRCKPVAGRRGDPDHRCRCKKPHGSCWATNQGGPRGRESVEQKRVIATPHRRRTGLQGSRYAADCRGPRRCEHGW